MESRKELNNLKKQLESLQDQIDALGVSLIDDVTSSNLPNYQDTMDNLRKSLQEKSELVQDKMQQAGEKTKQMAKQAEDYTRENPWQVTGAAIAIGVIAGLLMRPRK